MIDPTELAESAKFGTRFYRCHSCFTLKMINVLWVDTDEFTICGVNGCKETISELTYREFLVYCEALEHYIDLQQDLYTVDRRGIKRPTL